MNFIGVVILIYVVVTIIPVVYGIWKSYRGDDDESD